MKIHEAGFVHPTQPRGVWLRVFEMPGSRFLVTEERRGGAGVVATLGVYAERGEALARAEGRGRELERQRYRPSPAP